MNAHSKITENRYMKEETRKLVNFVDVLIFGHPKNVRRIGRNVTNPIRLLSFARKLVINAN